MKGRNQHIMKRSDGNWQVKGEGARRASFVTTTHSEAIKLGRRICSNQESELIIHRRDGRIRAKDSHGHDPFPPRGTSMGYRLECWQLRWKPSGDT